MCEPPLWHEVWFPDCAWQHVVRDAVMWQSSRYLKSKVARFAHLKIATHIWPSSPDSFVNIQNGPQAPSDFARPDLAK